MPAIGAGGKRPVGHEVHIGAERFGVNRFFLFGRTEHAVGRFLGNQHVGGPPALFRRSQIRQLAGQVPPVTSGSNTYRSGWLGSPSIAPDSGVKRCVSVK